MWKAGHNFSKGQMILMKSKLLYAKVNFKTGVAFSQKNWAPYEKKYAQNTKFNATKTWIEYINRLVSVVLGLSIACSVLFCWVYGDRNFKILSTLLLLLLGFQAWFGALVVYSELQPLKVSLHMFIALGILAIILWLIKKTYPKNSYHLNSSKPLSIAVLILLGVQILLGAQSREGVDRAVQRFGDALHFWSAPPLAFYLHRLSSIALLISVFCLFSQLKNTKLKNIAWYAFMATLASALVGIIIVYFDFPYLSQTAHLLLAAILFSLLFWIVICQPKTHPSSNK